MSKQLKLELIKRIFENIGAFSSGKRNILTHDFISNEKLKIKTDSGIEEHIIYNSELSTSETNNIRLALVVISNDDMYLTIMIGENTYGLVIDDLDSSQAYVYTENKWIPIDILRLLNILLVFEGVAQYGLLWNKLQADYVAAINKILIDLVDFV